MSTKTECIRLGLIGAGPWGRNYIHTIAGLKGVRLARLASRNPESPALVGPDCRISADWRELLAAEDLDGVIVATPPTLHAEMAGAAIDRGLPVLVEKPMTTDLGDAAALVERAGAKGAIFKVDHIHLYSAAWEALKHEAAALGPLRAVKTEAGNWGPFRRQTPMLWDWGSHDLAMCLDLIGRPPEKITARRLDARQTEDGHGEVLELGLDFGGVTASITIGNLFKEKKRLFRASFEGGTLVLDDTQEDKLRLTASPSSTSGGAGDPLPVAGGTPLERAVSAFASAISEGVPDLSDARLGVDVVRVLTRIDEELAADAA